MNPIPFQVRRFWSIVLGCTAARISVVDANRDEHYAIVPMDLTGRGNRARKELVLEQLAAHVQKGEEPGEVEIDLQPQETAV